MIGGILLGAALVAAGVATSSFVGCEKKTSTSTQASVNSEELKITTPNSNLNVALAQGALYVFDVYLNRDGIETKADAAVLLNVRIEPSSTFFDINGASQISESLVSIPAGASRATISVRVRPEALAASSFALNVNSSAPGVSGDINVQLRLTASNPGASPQASLKFENGIGTAVTSFSFPATSLNAVESKTFSVTNTGDGAASNVSFSALAAPFSRSSTTCGASLAAGARCDVTIAFSPAGASLFSSALDVNYDGGAGGLSSALALSGVGLSAGLSPNASFVDCAAATSAGDSCGGGVLAVGPVTLGTSAKFLMTTPGGCTDSTDPVCAGGVDTVSKMWLSSGSGTAMECDANFNPETGYSWFNGPANAMKGKSLGSQAEAIMFCENLNYGGYSDWYLPSVDELKVLHAGAANFGGGLAYESYWSSTMASSFSFRLPPLNITKELFGAVVADPNVRAAGLTCAYRRQSSKLVRCVRQVDLMALDLLPSGGLAFEAQLPVTTSVWKTVTLVNPYTVATKRLNPVIAGDFEINPATDTCSARSLSAGQSCTVEMRVNRSVHGEHTGALRFEGFAQRSTEIALKAQVFPSETSLLEVGDLLTGRVLFGGYTRLPNSGPYMQLMLTPSGCTNSSAPTCGGTGDTVTKTWGRNGALGTLGAVGEGRNNTSLISGYVGESVAADYCRDLVYGGYDDWYLPSLSDLSAGLGDRRKLQFNGEYWTSTEAAATTASPINLISASGTTGIIAAQQRSVSKLVRCMRHNAQPAILTASPSALDFGTVALPQTSSSWQTVVITNSGPRSKTLSSAFPVIGGHTSAGGAVEIGSNGCVGRSLDVGGTCSIEVRIHSATSTTVNKVLRVIEYDGSLLDIPITGRVQ